MPQPGLRRPVYLLKTGTTALSSFLLRQSKILEISNPKLMSVSNNLPSVAATLLIVDADVQARERLRGIFGDAGYRTMVAADAPVALRLMRDEHCDLAMLETELPDVDGVSLCRLLRAQPAMEEVPVIMLSADEAEERKVQAFAAGADDYIVKPSTPGELLSRVNTHLSVARRQWELRGTNRELSFLADLGRALLRTLDPIQVARRVAGATYAATDASLCACVTRMTGDRWAVCVFDRDGSADNQSIIDLGRVQQWLNSPGSAGPALNTDLEQFLLKDQTHVVEYLTPIAFGGYRTGVIVVAFDRRQDCRETECRLVDAAAQQATLALNVSSLYLAARESAATLAEEVDRRTAEAEMYERFTEAIIDSLPLSLYAIDRNYRIVAWNRNREQGELGLPRGEVLGRHIFDVLTKQKRDVLKREFEAVFTTGEIQRIELETVTPEGAARHWLISKIPMRAENGDHVSHVIALGEEITQRVKADRGFARAEKLAAVGRLAAGVVHEINNPLATIAACAEALQQRVSEGAFDASPDAGDLREYLGLIRDEAFRCKTITNGLLDFSRMRTGNRNPIKVAEVIKTSARLVTHQQRGENIEIVVEAPEGLEDVLGDEGQLQQAVVALSTNAIDAMPDGGTLRLRAHAAPRRVLIEVIDTGIGIPAENLTKIFDPFFTTKDVGAGTGLGLAVCYGIVSEHGGRLDVRSSPGAGTTFTISLPSISES